MLQAQCRVLALGSSQSRGAASSTMVGPCPRIHTSHPPLQADLLGGFIHFVCKFLGAASLLIAQCLVLCPALPSQRFQGRRKRTINGVSLYCYPQLSKIPGLLSPWVQELLLHSQGLVFLWFHSLHPKRFVQPPDHAATRSTLSNRELQDGFVKVGFVSAD